MEGNDLIRNKREQPSWARGDLDRVGGFGA